MIVNKIDSPLQYKIRLPIGDWSGDGHGQCSYYYIESNKPVEELREIHFKIKEVTGIDIHSICNEYNDQIDVETQQSLKDVGVSLDIPDYDIDHEGNMYLGPDDIKDIWICLLRKTDPTLILQESNVPFTPMLPFYGRDKHKRHIGFVGHGVFNL